MIGIIDYGASNLLSILKAFSYLKKDTKVIKSPDEIKAINKMVLPGVGAFETAVRGLKYAGLYDKILEWLKNNKPFLGICLGMQLLFEKSEESEKTKGFGILKGEVKSFKILKTPQIGWNQVSIVKKSKLFNSVQDGSFFYFIHSYYIKESDYNIRIGVTEYETNYTSAIEKDNICAVQFHPEKSGEIGLQLLRNWIEKC